MKSLFCGGTQQKLQNIGILVGDFLVIFWLMRFSLDHGFLSKKSAFPEFYWSSWFWHHVHTAYMFILYIIYTISFNSSELIKCNVILSQKNLCWTHLLKWNVLQLKLSFCAILGSYVRINFFSFWCTNKCWHHVIQLIIQWTYLKNKPHYHTFKGLHITT